MGMVKYSVIGLIIMLPFFMQSMIHNTQNKYKERQRAWIEHSIEEASYDAGFALKTYSTYAFDSHQAYDIQVPYREVLSNFFDSLTLREFNYSYEDFPLIAFIDYDGIVLYNPSSDQLGEKIFYTVKGEDECIYYTLSEEKTVFSYATGKLQIEDASLKEKNRVVMQTIESALNDYQAIYQDQDNIRFVLPEFEGDTSALIIDDIGLMIFYNPKNFSYLQGLESYKIIPSGIMKMDLTIDL